MIGFYVAGVLLVATSIVLSRPPKPESIDFRRHANQAIDLTGGQR